ncbi:MAG TPA: enoyl-CoA hydratase [Vicinamibacterales bacterium]|nr:enoyl-CoA hydratase [Vicinamibacterales bacterium]
MSASNIPQYGPAITWVASRTVMPSNNVAWDIKGSVGIVTFDRPEARNALTWEMYDALVEACDQAEKHKDLRVFIIRGAGGAFSAGTDIAQFKDFDGNDGVAYEKRLDGVIDRVERLPIITIAEVDGVAAGGGCAIALACDLRLCSERAVFGVPVARTLGNCLSITSTARMVDLIGLAATKDLLLTGRLIEAEEARRTGLATEIIASDQLSAEVLKRAEDLATRKGSTIKATKETLLLLRDHRRPKQNAANDILKECYGSDDFKQGVGAFVRRDSKVRKAASK